MCTVSMVGDHYTQTWPKKYPWIDPYVAPAVLPEGFRITPLPEVTREEFEALKRDVEEAKELLKRAAKYDERNNEPHCEMDDKVALLKKVAEMVGVSLDDVFGEAA